MTQVETYSFKVAPEFADLPVEDLGEGITVDHLYPPEEIAALRAHGLTDDAILELTRKQTREILGIPDSPARMTAQELLNANGIFLKSYDLGERPTTCPECSAKRKAVNQKKECLSVKIDDGGATWFCHNCKWKGPQKGQHTTTGRTADNRP